MTSHPWIRRLALPAALVGAWLPTPPGARAADLESLVMPGPVSAAHADVERDCRKCHASFDRAGENRLCLDCHEEVAADLAGGTGFHGRALAGDGETSCRLCHTEHRGRDADIVGLSEVAFDHGMTDFALEGAHARASCGGCHPAGTPHREAPSACVDCHRADDPHGSRLGDDCSDCHDVRQWATGRFDHGDTRFPLQGAHRDVDCALCHPNARYEGTASRCASCHLGNDVHRGRFGTKCETCHSVAAWDRAVFDHRVETGFALEGGHAEVRCAVCHAGGALEEDLPTDCIGCHRNDDDHRGRNGEACGDCHGTAAWDRVSFDHGRDTGFDLVGSHAGLDCGLCHRGDVHDEDLPEDCVGCHLADDAHGGTLGRDCGRCHGSSSWTRVADFDHGLTRFPLLGLHAVTSCVECHGGGRYRDAETGCSTCHADDAHQGRLGADCARCHTPNGWPFWQFDHSTETAFALHGAHADVQCRACHTREAGGRVRASTSCSACHAREDPHSGRLGRRCESCHDETSWKEVRR